MAIDPSNDPNPALRVELEAALVIIEEQVKGLTNFSKFEAIPDVLDAIRAQVAVRSRRMNAIQRVLDLLNGAAAAGMALKADGYPNLPEAQVAADILHEITDQTIAIDFAAKIFASSATAISLDLDNAVFTKQPMPAA